MQVTIYTEGSRQWGMGHLNRCLGFSRHFQSLGIAVRWVVHGDDVACCFFNDLDYGDIDFYDWHSAGPQTQTLSNSFCVIVDSYHASVEIYQRISGLVRYCIWIDDEARLDYPRGFVVNPNPLVVQKLPRDESKGYYLLSGFAYQVLRQEFSQPFKRQYSTEIQKVLVLMGGTDLRELTPLVVESILSRYPSAECLVVLPNADQRTRWASLENANCQLLGTQSSAQIRKLMLDADLAVTAAGQTLCEAAAVGLPTLAIGVVNNQRLHSQALEKAGAVRLVGWYDDMELKVRLSAGLEVVADQAVRAKMGRTASQVVDGMGTLRIISTVMGWSERLHLDLAREDDSQAVWEISNELTVRQYSIQKGTIPWEEHVAWYARAIVNSNLLFLVAKNDKGQVCGQLRYRNEGDWATVSISLSSQVRGGGEACKLLSQGDFLCFAHWPGVKRIEAEVSPQNPASAKSFLRAAYQLQELRRVHEGSVFHVYWKGQNDV